MAIDQHPYFDLWLHSNNELAVTLDSKIVQRVTLHEWPLSCVQRLQLENGEKIIYKAQFSEGVEAEFYERAISPLLPAHRNLGTYQQTRAMLIEHIDAPLMDELSLSDEEKVRIGQLILEAIAGIEGEVPVYQDFGSEEKWRGYALNTLNKLEILTKTGKFILTNLETVRSLSRWAESAEVRQLADSTATLLHADLSSDNIFVMSDSFRVIDWQYPRYGPAEVDFACYLDGVDLDPFKYTTPSAARMFYFTRLNWLVECKSRLFPEGESYDRQVADLAKKILG